MLKSTLIDKIRGTQGAGIIQVLIAIGLLGILAAAFSTMMVSQQKQLKFLEVKQDTIDSRNSLFRIFSQIPGYCVLANASLGDLTFDPSAIPGSIPANLIFENTTTVLMTKSGPLRGSPGVIVNDINLVNFAGSGDAYTADLEVDIRSVDNTLMKVQPVRLTSLAIKTQNLVSNPALKQIIACSIVLPAARTIVYRTTSPWAGGAISPCNNPPICNGTDTSLAVSDDVTTTLWGGATGFHAGNCYRDCQREIVDGQYIIPSQCGWGTSTGGISSCAPPVCPAGFTDLGSSCTIEGLAVGGPSGSAWGKCYRNCLKL